MPFDLATHITHVPWGLGEQLNYTAQKHRAQESSETPGSETPCPGKLQEGGLHLKDKGQGTGRYGTVETKLAEDKCDLTNDSDAAFKAAQGTLRGPRLAPERQ